MSTIFHATFDGKVLHPEEDVNLKPNTRYLVIINDEKQESESDDQGEYPLTAVLSLATDMGITDFAENHDYYAHGRAKQTDLP
ncbi:MAG: hypothetical protein ACRD8U_19000 [Pyrinomonadaceae bacterium]